MNVQFAGAAPTSPAAPAHVSGPEYLYARRGGTLPPPPMPAVMEHESSGGAPESGQR